jgi:hypothetical protein
MMTPKEWVENWKTLGPILDQIKRDELQSPNYADGLKIISGMLDWVCAHAEPTDTSGLVEMQRIFAKYYERQNGRRS